MSLAIQEDLVKHLEQTYIIDKELGRGGMGVVYLAHDRRLERPVAIKVLQMAGGQTSEGLSTEVVERFQREAKVVAKMSHPNLITVYDVGQVNDYYYMVQEFAEGKALSDLVHENQFLPPALVASIGQQISLALGVAHEQGIIHRDIKPANIILSSKGVAKLTDFGIAQLNQQDSGKLTQAGSMMGSFLYASPEQLQDASAVDERTDLYSLGVTLYELLVGKSPYTSDQLSQIILEIMNPSTVPQDLHVLNPNIPASLNTVVSKALQKDRSQRYQKAVEMAKDLGLLLQGTAESQKFQISFSEGSEGPRSRLGDSTLMRKTRIDQTLVSQLRSLPQWLDSAVADWKTENLTQLNMAQVLNKLMEPNLFGQAISGCLIVDQRFYLLLCAGQLVGAADLKEHSLGESVFDALPEQALSLALRVAPEGADLAPLLMANILHEQGEVVQSKLDSSLMDLQTLIESFSSEDESFSGYMVCHTEDNVFYYGYDQGQQIFASQARESEIERSTWLRLSHLAARQGVILNVYWPRPEVVGSSARKLLSGSRLIFSYRDENKSSLHALCELGKEELPIHLIRESKENIKLEFQTEGSDVLRLKHHSFPLAQQLEDSVARRFSEWLVREYFYLLNSSGNANSLKYIYSWIPAIKEFRFGPELAGEDGAKRCFTLGIYGVIPSEGYEKLLFLVRVGKGTPEALSAFIDDVIQVKQKLTKSGDIGGAMYVSEGAFDTDSLKLFYERTVEPRKKGFGLGALDKLTKYKGFVRIGMNRGFHLNLIEHDAAKQQFEVIAPLLK